MANSGYGSDGIYRSLRPSIAFPSDPHLSFVAFLFRNAAAYPDRTALIDAESGQSITYHELKKTVASFAAGLTELGIRKGDTVLILSPNSIHFPVCFLSVLSIGAIATAANPSSTISELSKQAKDSGAKLVVTVSQLRDKANALGIPSVTIGADTSSESEFVPPTIRQSDVAALFYSSGTTGVSKGAMLTHRNLICAALMASHDQDADGEPANTFLCFLPMFHLFGMSVATCAQLRRGNALVVMRSFEMETALRMVEKHRVTHMYAVPPVMLVLAKQGRVSRRDLGSLRWICSGAAPVGIEVMEEVSNIFPNANVLQVSTTDSDVPSKLGDTSVRNKYISL